MVLLCERGRVESCCMRDGENAEAEFEGLDKARDNKDSLAMLRTVISSDDGVVCKLFQFFYLKIDSSHTHWPQLF